MLIATDIAARGIDVNQLSHVINYELPNISETYVHRIGRTGRAGHDGIAISFCESEELPYLKDIQKLIGLQIPVVKDHPWNGKNRMPARPKNWKKKQKPIRCTGAAKAMVIIGAGRNRLKADKGKAGRVRIERLPADKDKE